VQPVTAGAAVAVAAGPVAGQVDEDVPAGRRRAAAQPVALAGHHEHGEAHGQVRGYPVGHRGGGPGHVNVRAAAIVRNDLRDRPGLREQGVHHLDGGRLAARLAGGGDGVQPGAMRAQPRHVRRGGGTPVERVPAAERLHARQAQFLASARPAGVDQLDAGGQRLQLVSIKSALTPVRPLS